jgi:hypothetical protein
MRSLCRSTLILLVTTLGAGCSDDKDPMVTTTATTPTTPTTPTSDPGTGGENTTEITTGDDGPTTDDPGTTSQTTVNPTANPTNDPTNDPTVDPSTTDMTGMTSLTSETTSDPTANPTTVDPTGDPTGDPDEAATQLCVDTINMYRATLGLPPYQRWTDAEVCSDTEAQLDGESNTPHGSFGMCGEFAQNECPGWPAPPETMIEGCLAQMWAEGPGDDFNLHGHYINMSSESYTQVACGYAIVNGEVWAVQNFK